jgi:inner membrane protein
MDNLCHTLVGAALAEAGLKRRTALGSATLMIAANFPDIDVVAVPLGSSLAIRRGITHGLPAQVILPFVLTAIMIGWHRWRGGEAPRPRELLLLSVIGILTHPFLDWMNTYGMRWLMPLDGTWWYGDTLFILDPWILLALTAGIWFSRRRERNALPSAGVPARAALVAIGAYLAVMLSLSRITREGARQLLAARGITPDTLVVDPLFATAVTRGVTYLWEGSYRLATYRLLPGELSEPWFEIPVNDGHPAIAIANQTEAGRAYHSWARLPYYLVETAGDTTWVLIGDARYTLIARRSWAATRIPVARGAPLFIR